MHSRKRYIARTSIQLTAAPFKLRRQLRFTSHWLSAALWLWVIPSTNSLRVINSIILDIVRQLADPTRRFSRGWN